MSPSLPMTVRSKIPLEVRLWWEDLERSEQDKIKLNLGGLVNLLNVRPRCDIIKALVTFWDPAHNVFRFSNFELTPTLEEMAGYMDVTEGLRHKYLIAPRAVNSHKFMDLLKISKGVPYAELDRGFSTLQFIYQRYGHIGGFDDLESGVCSRGIRQNGMNIGGSPSW